MGVFIYPCKLKEQVSKVVSVDEFNELCDKYEALGEELLVMENTDTYNDFISPFEEGIYTYNSIGEDVSVMISYGTYGDFIQRLEDIREVVDDYNAYETTINASGIDNCISYEVAKEMLEEFEKHKKAAETYFMDFDGEDYGSFFWGIYTQYMTVLQECVNNKGIVRYH